jgi:hypothetical protein
VDKVLAAAPWLVAVAFGVWNGWLTWRWEDDLSSVARFPSDASWSGAAQRATGGNGSPGGRSEALTLLTPTQMSSICADRSSCHLKLSDAALVSTLATWAFLGLRG